MNGVDIERLLTQGPTKKELADALADVQKQLDDLKRERAWHLTAERPPTESDADKDGFVWAQELDRGRELYRPWAWFWVAKNPVIYPAWCRTPGSAPADVIKRLIKLIEEEKI